MSTQRMAQKQAAKTRSMSKMPIKHRTVRGDYAPALGIQDYLRYNVVEESLADEVQVLSITQ